MYVRDKHMLGLKAWFENKNPHALAQTMERMIEAARQGYWQADAKTLDELKERYRELAQRHDVQSDNKAFNDFVKVPGAGFGLLAAPPGTTRTQSAADLAPPAKPAPVQGMVLERVENKTLPPAPFVVLGLALLALAMLGGMGQAVRQQSCV